MSIDSLEYRLEQFIHAFDERRTGSPGSYPADENKRARVEELARAIVREFGEELNRPSTIERALAASPSKV